MRITKTLYKDHKDQYGLAPVYLRIHLNNTVAKKLINSKIKAKPENWKNGNFLIETEEANNKLIAEKISEINKFYLFIHNKDVITAEEFVRLYKKGDAELKISDLLQTIIDISVNNNSQKSTINKVKSCVKRIKRYFEEYSSIQNLSDINQTTLEDIGKHFIFKKGYKTSTVNQDMYKVVGALKYLIDTKRIVNHNHFRKLTFGKPILKNKWSLNSEQMKKIIEFNNSNLEDNKRNNNLKLASKWFIAMFYTGCNFDDMKHTFNFNQCYIKSNTHDYFYFKRKKTGVECFVPVINESLEVLKYFDGSHFNDYKYQYSLNYQLKVLSDILQFDVTLTSKIPRITYGSIFIRKYDIDTVQNALGHKNRSTTEKFYDSKDIEMFENNWKAKGINNFKL